MKFQIGRNELLGALTGVIGVVERRQTLPILSNVLMEVSDDRLHITATDLEIEMKASAQVQNLAPGRLTLPARKLYDITRGLPEGAELSIDTTGDKAVVRSGRSRYSLACLSADEFASLEMQGDARPLTLSSSALRRLIEKTQFAMAQQDVRYYLNGTLLELRPAGLRTVATDGHRLALAELAVSLEVGETMSVIVPRKAILELMRLLTGQDVQVQLYLGSGQLKVDVGDLQLTTKLIDGRFPDYERVIPTNGDKRVTADRDLVRQALARTAILSNEKFKGVRLSLDKGRMLLQTHNPEHEEAEEELEVDYDGEALEIGFNVNYLMDALGALGSSAFTLDLRNSESSGLIHAADDSSARYVVMPMRL
jgi:DNA polymerase III subunit beta